MWPADGYHNATVKFSNSREQIPRKLLGSSLVYQINPLWISSTYPIAAQQQQQQFCQKCTTAAEDCERRLPGSDSRNNNPFAPNLPNPMMVWAHTTSRWRSLTRWTWSLPLRCSSLTLPLRQRNLGIHPLLCSFMCSSCIMIQCCSTVRDGCWFENIHWFVFYVFNCYNFSILRRQNRTILGIVNICYIHLLFLLRLDFHLVQLFFACMPSLGMLVNVLDISFFGFEFTIWKLVSCNSCISGGSVCSLWNEKNGSSK